MIDITIQEAQPNHAGKLSRIAFAAKSYWGYSAEQMELWRGEFLTISPDYIRANRVWNACIGQQIAGFAAVEDHGEEVVLEHLWVSPDTIGKGVGKRLFQHVASIIPEFVFTSDPHADDFYLKMGAQKIGEYPSMLQGRMLTQFRYASKLNG